MRQWGNAFATNYTLLGAGRKSPNDLSRHQLEFAIGQLIGDLLTIDVGTAGAAGGGAFGIVTLPTGAGALAGGAFAEWNVAAVTTAGTHIAADIENILKFAADGEKSASTPLDKKESRVQVDPEQINSFDKDIKRELDKVLNNEGTPRPDDAGNQKIFEARELKKTSPKAASKWENSLEWDVPGTDHRILEKRWPNGTKTFGVVKKHQYHLPPIPVRIKP